MSKKIILNIVFYGLIVVVAAGAGIFYGRNFLSKTNLPQQKTVSTTNQPVTKTIPALNKNKNIPTPNINANRCIITVLGKQYDVTELRNTHTGGDVFNCGTDMTLIFQGQHGDNLKMIEKYLVK